MAPNSPPLDLAADAAVLVVLLPRGVAAGPAQPAPAPFFAQLTLQRQLGAAIRVLLIDEAKHPAVVHSFGATDLPSFVLVRQGVEVWRQRGLPEGDAIVPLLLSKLRDGSARAKDE